MLGRCWEIESTSCGTHADKVLNIVCIPSTAVHLVSEKITSSRYSLNGQFMDTFRIGDPGRRNGIIKLVPWKSSREGQHIVSRTRSRL